MPAHKKHLTRWFTTSDFRAINLDWVTDVRLFKDGDQIIGAQVYQGLGESDGQMSVRISALDAIKLFQLLV